MWSYTVAGNNLVVKCLLKIQLGSHFRTVNYKINIFVLHIFNVSVFKMQGLGLDIKIFY